MTAESGQVVKVSVVQARMRWYRSADDFKSAIEGYMKQAAKGKPSLVAFPEDIGALLVAIDDYALVKDARTLREATEKILGRYMRELPYYLNQYRVSPSRALLLLRAARIRSIYENTFASAARRYKVCIAAGSVLLPDPKEDNGAVYNVAYLFGPQGQTVGTQKKVNLIPLEQAEGLDLSPGKADALKVFKTPIGRIGISICADCWDASIADRLKRLGADILIGPTANPEAWTDAVADNMKLSLWARVQETGAYGLQSCAVGQFLDLPFAGISGIYAPSSLTPDKSGYLARAAAPDREEVISASIRVRE
ncbi:MAG: hypothetical protein IT210_08740 [Armatimonadetes bacterium]|nr:hypothetical protein [Armatimonadota bacterium]